MRGEGGCRHLSTGLQPHAAVGSSCTITAGLVSAWRPSLNAWRMIERAVYEGKRGTLHRRQPNLFGSLVDLLTRACRQAGRHDCAPLQHNFSAWSCASLGRRAV